jgi:hypothetical protein
MSYASQGTKQKLGELWTSPDTFATSLLSLAIDEFGTQCFDWEPETIWMGIKEKYGVDVPQGAKDRLMAGINLMTTNLFYTSVEAFTQITNVLNGARANFYLYDPVEPYEAGWALTEVLLLEPPTKEEREDNDNFKGRFSPEVLRYMGVMLEEDGIDNPPDLLKIADMGPQTVTTAEETFADDPAIFGGFQKISNQKSQDIVDYIKGQLDRLIAQLKTLPLRHRDEQSWQGFLDRAQSGRALSKR